MSGERPSQPEVLHSGSWSWGAAFDLVAAGIAIGSLAGLAGAWNWICDLTTHFRWYWMLLTMGGLAVCLRWRRPTAVGCLAVALVANGRDLLPYWLPTAIGVAAHADGQAVREHLRVTTVNVHRINEETDDVAAFLVDRQPDVVAVLEVDDKWAAMIDGLGDRWPHRVVEPRPDNFGIAVLSRWPLDEVMLPTYTSTGYPSIVATVRRDGGAFRFIATHPFPPFNAGDTRQLTEHLDGVAATVASSSLPCIVAGDFNATPWSRPFRRLIAESGLVDSGLGWGMHPTWHTRRPAPRIPIDHILVPPGTEVVCRRVGPYVGSDHYPVEADLILP